MLVYQIHKQVGQVCIGCKSMHVGKFTYIVQQLELLVINRDCSPQVFTMTATHSPNNIDRQLFYFQQSAITLSRRQNHPLGCTSLLTLFPYYHFLVQILCDHIKGAYQTLSSLFQPTLILWLHYVGSHWDAVSLITTPFVCSTSLQIFTRTFLLLKYTTS